MHRRPMTSVKRSLFAFLLLVVGLLLTSSVSFSQEARTWTDSTGKFTIVGKLASHDDKSIRIEKSDGQVISVPLDKLSTADQTFIAKLAESNPFQPEDENPFKQEEESPFRPEMPATQKAADADSAKAPFTASADGQPREIQLDYDAIRSVSMTPTKLIFGVDVTPAAIPSFTADSIPIRSTLCKWDEMVAMAVNGSGRVALNFECKMRSLRFAKKEGLVEGNVDDIINRFVIADAITGKVVGKGMYVGDKSFRMLALHDDGVRFAVRRNGFGSGNSGVLELWALDGADSIVRGFQVTPFVKKSRLDETDIEWAEFVGDLLLVGASERVVAFRVADMQPQYEFTLKGNLQILPDKKHLVFWREDQLAVLEIASGKVVCTTPLNSLYYPRLQVDPTGERLMGVSHSERELSIISLRDGKLLSKFEIPESTPIEDGLLLNDRYLLSPKGDLIDVRSFRKVWTIAGAQAIRLCGDRAIFYRSERDEGPGAVFCRQLPGEALSQRLDQLTPQSDFLCLEPGAKVRIDVTGIPDRDQREPLLQSLSRKLEASSFVVDPIGPVTLRALVVDKGPETVNYRSGFEEDDVVIHKYESRLEFVAEGKVVWYRFSDNIPRTLKFDVEEGIKAAAAEASRPSYEIYRTVSLPQKMAVPNDGKGFGQTNVTVTGLE
ncbi:hypothetical protein LOC68_13830 [Blastopirellula sp. JC732]|uniref:SLA1 homology domain-containing protein n=1 Tax=Blastopirellula sediminis TaxID=2894196 RepID=A0A9X1MNK7_9BACT|nr:SHD1 domain-containing protein [Blastopirellula sediminis]MCC9607232.1 hypothetical protein [Blastopirellula sediminis]MCC9629475.1 hypothetical protein [Blastopirellula sediminis]